MFFLISPLGNNTHTMDVIFMLTDIFFGFRYFFLTRFPALKNKYGNK